MFPQRMRWSSVQEQVWDWIMDGQHERFNEQDVFNPTFTHIGVACNCHPVFEEYCVIEFGQDVKSNVEVTEDYLEGPSIGIQLKESLPLFLPRGHPECKENRTDGMCGKPIEFEQYTPFAKPTSSGTNDFYDIAVSLFVAINQVRQDNSILSGDYVNAIISDEFPGYSLNNFTWSEALANAARQVINFENSCGTFGDQNGRTIPEVLSRYFAYSFENLFYFKFDSPFLLDATSPGSVLEHIIFENGIDHTWLEKEDRMFIGIGCTCSASYLYGLIQQGSCYIVLAESVVGKRVVENIPTYHLVDTTDGF